MCHGFTDAVGIGNQKVSRFEAQALFGIDRKRKQANYRAVGFEAQNLE